MKSKTDKWFVEEFHLRSPIEEFEEHARLELQRMADMHHPHEPAYRAAIELVSSRITEEPVKKQASADNGEDLA